MIAGFATQNVKQGETAPILVKASLTSDASEFHQYMESIMGSYLARAGLLVDNVVAFLLVFHRDSDNTVDVYVNEELGTVVEVRTKRRIEAGEPVSTKDMIDVRRLQFPNISLEPTDRIIYCAKFGWKFGLYFDLDHDGELDLDALSIDLGSLYRKLTYEHVYKSLEPSPGFDTLFSDGWFPFAELIPNDWRLLSAAYEDRFDFEARVEKVIGGFTTERVEAVAARWWDKPVFEAKKKLLGAGVRAYLQGDEDGYVLCIKTLATEIEGVLRAQHASDIGSAMRLKTPALIKHLIDKEVERAGHSNSLLLPDHFLRYLRDVIFRNFDVTTGDLRMSRNTAGHGVAKPEDYNRTRALQLILAVDQLWFFA